MHTTQHRKDEGNPYTLMLKASMPPTVNAVDFSWVRAVIGRYDVLHIHWPELLMRSGSGWRRILKLMLTVGLCVRVKVTNTLIVQTIHNITPHEPGSSFERRVLNTLDHQTSVWIKLNPLEIQRTPGRVVEILHGHYRDWFSNYDKGQLEVGRLLFFGLIRPYKQVDSLLHAFSKMPDELCKLRIVGSCPDEKLRSTISATAGEIDNVSVDFRFVTDEQLALEVGRAELIVLPYRDLYNSGAVLLALSLARPVLIPHSAASVALQSEFGEEWVLLFDGPLDEKILESCLSESRRLQETRTIPDLSKRDWDSIARAHVQVYTCRSK